MSLKRVLYVNANKSFARMPRKVRGLARSTIAQLPFERLLPRYMAVEPSNVCNLRCPLCPVGAKTMARRGGFMDREKYRILIDEISSHVQRISMNFAGEPLLHPHIGDLIAYAERKGIEVTVGTHGNIDKMEELVESGVSTVLFALDGTTEDVYQQYRVGGKMEAALANLEKLVVARSRAKVKRPRVILQFVVMRHNMHQIDELVSIGKSMGVDLISLQPVCVNDFFEEKLTDLIAQWVPDDSPYLRHPEVLSGGRRQRPPLCVWAIQSVVLYNGDVTICCFDASARNVVGNAFGPGGFRAVWRSPEYRAMRKRVVKQDLQICQECDVGFVKPTRFPPNEETIGARQTRDVETKRKAMEAEQG